jgi:hypothetical protein
MQPKSALGADGAPVDGELTLEAYAEQLKRARQLSGLASLLPKGAMAAAGGSDASVADTLRRQEDIVRCGGAVGAVARSRVLSGRAGCAQRQRTRPLVTHSLTRARRRRRAAAR